MPSPIEDALTQLRDNAHVNQGALAAVQAEAQGHFDVIRTWPDSPTKKAMLLQLGTLIQAYRNAQREALELRDAATGALDEIGGAVPPLPDGSGPIDWSVEEW